MRLALALLFFVLIAATCGQHETGDPVNDEPPILRVEAPKGLGERAYSHVARLCSFGPRFPGSPGWQRGLDYIAHQLTLAGLRPVRDRWTDEEHGIVFENIHATIPGSSPHRILLACHHDTKRTEGHADPAHNFHFVGANDSGSGVGLLLELARVLAHRNGRATVQIAFFDGEESLDWEWSDDRSLFGSRHFVAAERRNEINPPEGDPVGRIRAMVLLDMVGAADLQIDLEENSTPALRDIFRRAARACGHSRVFFQRRLPIKDDHIPFLDAGIPAIDLIDLVDNPQWHTPDDTLEHIAPQSLHLVGEVVLTALPAIEELYFPGPSSLDLPGEGR